jgi:hypothetical protein
MLDTTEDTMTLKRIRLELARTQQFPEGHAGCGYEFTAPLDRKGKLDTAGWVREKDHCGVRRFWQSTTDEHGSLVHHRGNQWAFAWPGDADNEEPIFRFDEHAFTVGEYISVTEHDGVSRPFRVVAVEPVR